MSEPATGAAAARPAAPGGWRHRDHTRGRLLASLWVLALPLLLGSVVGDVTFQLVDLSFLARLGEAPLAAVVIVNQTLRQLVFILAMAIGFGTQALIARAVGRGDAERADHVAGQAFLLGALLWGVTAAAGVLFPERLFALAGAEASFAVYGVPYLRLCMLLNLGVMMSLFASVLTGAGDTATPLFVFAIELAIALLAEWVLIFGHFGAPALGVRGVALGIATGHLVGAAIGLAVLFRGYSRVHLRVRHLRPDPRVLGRILALSWPPALQMVGSVVTIFAFLRLTAEFGAQVQAAYAIGLRLGMVAPIICFPLAGACATLVGQALGAGNVPRAWRAVGVGLLVHGGVMLSIAAATFWFRGEILALFSDEPEVIRVGSEYLLYASGVFALWAFQFVFMRALQGAGDVLVPMAISLAATALSIGLAFALARRTSLGPTGIWIAFLTSTAVTTLGNGAWLATGRWTRRRL